MISVIIPTLNAEARFAKVLEALVPAAIEGLVKEVIVVDGGSDDTTLAIAEDAGARILQTEASRGGQMKTGGEAARGEWLLFLHADTVLSDGWMEEVRGFIEQEETAAAVFSLAFDAPGLAPKIVAFGAMLRTRWKMLPYGDQGLLLSRKTYDAIGGFKQMPLFEDVDIMRRIAKTYKQRAVQVLSARAVTSPERYENEGYINRVIRNFILVMRYRFGASPEKLAEGYLKRQ